MEELEGNRSLENHLDEEESSSPELHPHEDHIMFHTPPDGMKHHWNEAETDSPASARCVLAAAERCLTLLRGAPPRPRAAPSAAELRPCRLSASRRRAQTRPPHALPLPAEPPPPPHAAPAAVRLHPCGSRRPRDEPAALERRPSRPWSPPGAAPAAPHALPLFAERHPRQAAGACRRRAPSPRLRAVPAAAVPATRRRERPLVVPCRHAPSAVNSFTELEQAAVDTRDPALLPLILVGPLEEKDAVVAVRDDMKVGKGLRVCVGSMDACPSRFVVYASREASWCCRPRRWPRWRTGRHPWVNLCYFTSVNLM
ncbi:hypothetical protein BRADI_4g08476v3 [Brachypodium distachyon]|uniref:Uncharacterized protein n=1 Tax=Brachypodium distachyon TaxID=15368 RepID=A0A2K2CL97_BRADI|nr:hypothetical protein BRADI_4g08476v3 [Brachypodium distachyon]